MPEILGRLTKCLSRSGDIEIQSRALRHSYIVSADMAHALHPNYEAKHDPGLQPKMHGGLVIKVGRRRMLGVQRIRSMLRSFIDLCIYKDKNKWHSRLGPYLFLYAYISSIMSINVMLPIPLLLTSFGRLVGVMPRSLIKNSLSVRIPAVVVL